ncbi:MAG: hypothetical protein OXG81_13230 [Acidobacteria bacterium]|nr:hypothetical protein [Acidobacteriota bacterium]
MPVARVPAAKNEENHLTASDSQSRPRRSWPGAPRPVVPLLAIVLLLLVGASTAGAQERYSYTVTLSPTIGGSFSEGTDNSGVQASFTWRTQPRTAVGVRLGSISLSGDQVGSQASPTFKYATVAGEYRFQELYYQSGVFFGLGLYQLGNGVESEEGPGLTAGVTGDFPINKRLSVVVELSGHYADIDAASTYASAHVGVAYQF